MRLIFAGDRSGAFAMRGVQMAEQRAGWRALTDPETRDLRGVDAVVVVKSLGADKLARIRAHGAPVVYDALDFWPADRATARFLRRDLDIEDVAALDAFTRPLIAPIRPRLVLGATQAMTRDLAAMGWASATHRHHFDPRLETAAPRGRRRPIVLYHGHRGFLGPWKRIIPVLCAVRGARFVTSMEIPPPAADVVLALRGGAHGHPLARRWKSNVKAATAARLGLPFVAWPESAYLETADDAFWFTSPDSLHRALGAALRAERPAPETRRHSVAWSADRLEETLASRLR